MPYDAAAEKAGSAEHCDGATVRSYPSICSVLRETVAWPQPKLV